MKVNRSILLYSLINGAIHSHIYFLFVIAYIKLAYVLESSRGEPSSLRSILIDIGMNPSWLLIFFPILFYLDVRIYYWLAGRYTNKRAKVWCIVIAVLEIILFIAIPFILAFPLARILL